MQNHEKLAGNDPIPSDLKDNMNYRQWYSDISEKERKHIVGSIPGALEYGLSKSFNLLPIAAQVAVRNAHFEATPNYVPSHDPTKDLR